MKLQCGEGFWFVRVRSTGPDAQRSANERHGTPTISPRGSLRINSLAFGSGRAFEAMDSDNEIARAKWLLISAVIFLVSGCVSWGELVYLVAGHDAQADVVKAYEVTRGRLSRKQQRLTVDFSFTEPNGTRRTGTDTVPTDWPLPVGGKVPVRYTAGADGSSRLAGHVNWVGLTFFGLSVAAIGVFGFRLWREASEATSDRKPKRK